MAATTTPVPGKVRALRLRRTDVSGPGLARRRQGRGWVYLDERGERVRDPDVLARVGELVIPPAWTDVWIAPYPNGHLQALGTDAAGRKQYLYHPKWRERRDAEKFEEMVRFAHALPALRERVAVDLTASAKLTERRVLACAVRLLDRGFFRIGSEQYAAANESYGLATMLKQHVRLDPSGLMLFDFPAKHSKQMVKTLADPLVFDLVAQLKRRRGGGPELLAFRERGEWKDIRSAEVNAYLKDATGDDFSAKDFRTWNATVLAAVALGVSGEVAGTKTGRKAAINRAVKEVSHYLGNTPAVARASYIDPRVFDAYAAGLVIRPALDVAAQATEGAEADELPIHQRVVEEAVLDLLNEREASPGVERVAA